MGKKLSGAQKRKKRKEKEEAAERARAEVERLKLGPTELWTGLVLHHKDVFVSHVLPKLNTADRFFLKKVNRQSWGVLKCGCLRMFIHLDAGMGVESHGLGRERDKSGRVLDQAWFCTGVAQTNKLEFLKCAREVKQCEWNAKTINKAAYKGNLEMVKYCFSNGCPCDEEESYKQAVIGGHLDCLRFLFAKVNPSRDTEGKAAVQATCRGYTDIVKYFVEERKISDEVKSDCVYNAARYGRLDCLKYLLGEEARAPLDDWRDIACTRYYEHPDCVNYLLEKGCPEPTDEEYAAFVEGMKERQ
ncbi:unnamed protein product [Bathycoccus prasinos]